MPELKLVRSEPDGIDLRRLAFDQPLQGHTTPGQFVTVHLEGHKPAYFALASSPGEPVELLVKVHGDAAETLAHMPPGTTVEFSNPIGHGFPLPEGDTRPLVVLAAGSGISAVRPVIEAEVRKGLPRPVTLFHGAYTPAHRAYVDHEARWEEAGVVVRPVYSDPVEGWRGDRGFVQQAAADAGFVRSDVTVVLCGFKEMVDEARRMWIEVGATPEQLLVNF
jgi:NAD(P)H-flavin reductase